MRQRIITFVFLALIVVGLSYLVSDKTPGVNNRLSAEATTDMMAPITQVVLSNDQTQKTFRVELAVTPDEQAQGLSDRQSMAENAGMLFVFKPAQPVTFWMKDMLFSLDMVWIRDNQIIGIERNLPIPSPGSPTADLPTYAPTEPVDYVLEIGAGQADKFKIGDRVELVDSQTI